jgi:hypothetical protein
MEKANLKETVELYIGQKFVDPVSLRMHCKCLRFRILLTIAMCTMRKQGLSPFVRKLVDGV